MFDDEVERDVINDNDNDNRDRTSSVELPGLITPLSSELWQKVVVGRITECNQNQCRAVLHDVVVFDG